uniref:Putative E3 ubiquitin-protein ligase UBR7 n=1 Tax=Tetraodon nigroviridis TaxID=99883 RepID=H3C9Z4_TETNG
QSEPECFGLRMSEEQTVSLVDVLEEDEELEEEASAVLGGSDSDHCSYPQGYVKRQALYACNTCTPKGGEPTGVCLACSYKCHEGHDLFELYTKRSFRCDCGNEKFAELKCKLFPEKDSVNSLNKYSQNFFGLYCTCSRPYPDPDDQVEDEMIQCVVCEDWLHGRHLGRVVPDGVELLEMICESCMNRNTFLWTYAAHLAGSSSSCVHTYHHGLSSPWQHVLFPDSLSGADRQVKKETTADGSKTDFPDEAEKVMVAPATASPQSAWLFGDELQTCCKRSREEAGSCRLKELAGLGRTTVHAGAVFWPSSWRSKLCTCHSCQESLSAGGLSFLLDDSDTVLAYENKGKSSEETRQHDPLMTALDSLNRVQQLEIIHGYNDMKSDLKDFLQTFAAEGKVVTPEDIHQFFEQQQSRKRQRFGSGRLHCT